MEIPKNFIQKQRQIKSSTIVLTLAFKGQNNCFEGEFYFKTFQSWPNAPVVVNVYWWLGAIDLFCPVFVCIYFTTERVDMLHFKNKIPRCYKKNTTVNGKSKSRIYSKINVKRKNGYQIFLLDNTILLSYIKRRGYNKKTQIFKLDRILF